jgi:hypothetical protein
MCIFAILLSVLAVMLFYCGFKCNVCTTNRQYGYCIVVFWFVILHGLVGGYVCFIGALLSLSSAMNFFNIFDVGN